MTTNPLEACNSRGQVFLRGPAGRAKGVVFAPITCCRRIRLSRELLQQGGAGPPSFTDFAGLIHHEEWEKLEVWRKVPQNIDLR